MNRLNKTNPVMCYLLLKMSACNSYTMVCSPVRGVNPRALASGLSPVQADKLWYNYFILLSSM